MSKKKYDEDFQKETVRLIYASGKSQREIAKDLGLSEWQVSTWKKKYSHEFEKGGKHERTAEAKIKELEKENATLRQEREILKKAMGITLKV